MHKPILGHGLCQCGCGQTTAVSNCNDARHNYVKGEPRPYVFGHSTRTGAVAFWAKVPDHLPADQCWEWQGSRDRKGYGSFTSVQYGTPIVSRLMWMHVNGAIPDDTFVLHRCDNPPCCNPAHLFLGTQKDNMRDMWQKGRAPWQANQPPQWRRNSASAKLTEQDIHKIRRLYATGDITKAGLGRAFGVSPSLIWSVIEGRAWADIKQEQIAS